MYPLDLARVITSLVVLNQYQDINIGSDLAITMFDLAEKISKLTSNQGVQLLNPEESPTNYVPSILKLKQLVWQQEFISLDHALEKWIIWIETTNRLAREE